MKKVIVTTTINPPTDAIRKYDAMPDWELVVIGDKKTPADYHLERGIYVTPEEQEKYDPELSELIGWNSIQRRNFAFLWAHDMGADIIATVDDDNIPLEGWSENLIVGTETEMDVYEDCGECFDPIGATNYPHLWHRGFPLQLLRKRNYAKKTRKKVKVDIQADFWNGDPDIDAICRMEHRPDCTFADDVFPFAAEALSPFNSQNTFFTKDVLPHYPMLPHIGRLDDIWAAYHVESLGYRVAYGKASVRQDRNVHDFTRDMVKEFIGYEHSIDVVRAINAKTYDPKNHWPERTLKVFEAYRKHFA